MRKLLLAAALILGGLAAPALAQSTSKEFPRLWPDAGNDENRKKEIIDRLAKERSDDAAQILVAVAQMPSETGPVVEHAIHRLAELEGSEGDAWMREEMRKGKLWPDRCIIVRAFGRRAGDDARKLLISALGDKAWQVEATAIEAMRRHPGPDVIDALLGRWAKLDLKDEASARIAGDIRDTLLVMTEKDFQTAADAKSWWSANDKTWKPKRGSGPIESKESVTQERAPRLFDDIASRRVILVLDTSASMRVETGAEKDAKKPRGINRFEVMRREVKRVIEDLPPGTTFNVIGFGDKVLAWKGQLAAASDSNKKNATRFMDALKPDGATNSYGALEQAFKNAEVDTLYFLSDGYPTVGKTDFNAILGDVKRWNTTRNIRIHTIAFVAGDGKPIGVEEGDKKMPKEFMRRLAEENGGRYKLVE